MMFHEIKIGNAVYPSLILIPIGIIVLALALLIISLVKSNKKEMKRKGKKGEEKEKGKKVSLFMLEKRKYEKKKEVAEDSYVSCLRNLDRLKRRLKNLRTNEAWNKFSDIVKNFFKEFLKLEYEFTYEELSLELEKRRKRKKLINFIKKLDIKYAKSSSKKELKELISEFTDILKEMLAKEKEIPNLSTVFKKRPLAFMERFSRERKKIEEFCRLFEEWEKTKKDVKKEKEIKEKISNVFLSISVKERKRLYKELRKFYESIRKSVKRPQDYEKLKEMRERLRFLAKRLYYIPKIKEEVKKELLEEKRKEEGKKIKLKKIGKKEKKRLMNQLDKIIKILRENEKVRVSTLAEILEEDRETALKWASFLAEKGIVDLEYPLIGKPYIKLKEYI